jgi:hypothetical protein
MKNFNKNIKSSCRKIWNDYDDDLMYLGTLILVLSVFAYIFFFHYADFAIKFANLFDKNQKDI